MSNTMWVVRRNKISKLLEQQSIYYSLERSIDIRDNIPFICWDNTYTLELFQ